MIMGLIDFVLTKSAETVNEAFNSLYSETLCQKDGNSDKDKGIPYHLSDCTLKFDKYLAINETKARQHIKKVGNGQKNKVHYVDLGVMYYEVLEVKTRNLSKQTPKYRRRYVVSYHDPFQQGIPAEVKRYLPKTMDFVTKLEADKLAVELAFKTKRQFNVKREYVLEAGQPLLSETYVETKCYRKKPSFKEMENKKITPIHKYMFYGWAVN